MSDSFPIITAHTGCHGTAANTLQSAVSGLSLGADFVEVDVRSDADGRLVLWHDHRVHIRNVAPLALSELRVADLLELELAGRIRFDHQAGRVTTLEELLLSLKGSSVRINLDIKDDRSATQIADVLDRAGFTDRVVVTGCERDRAPLAPQSLPVFLNTDFDARDVTASGRQITKACAYATDLGCCGININHRLCTPEVAAAAAKRSLLVSVWTVEPVDFLRYIEMGVDNITTLHVRELVAARNAHARNRK